MKNCIEIKLPIIIPAKPKWIFIYPLYPFIGHEIYKCLPFHKVNPTSKCEKWKHEKIKLTLGCENKFEWNKSRLVFPWT